jgi:predicted nucleotidyltransferase/DNA-binding transcriptional regulator YiaG
MPSRQKITFFHLARILDVSANTLYSWRRGYWSEGCQTGCSPLPVHVDRIRRKNHAWVYSDEMLAWLEKNRPALVPRLKQRLARSQNVEPSQERVAERGAIGLRIKHLREERGLSKSELARSLNVSLNAVWNWEERERMPRPATIRAMAKSFGVSPEDLVSAKRPEGPNKQVHPLKRKKSTASMKSGMVTPKDSGPYQIKNNIEFQKTLAEFCKCNHIRKLSLFGSVLRDDFGPDSDVDVLVEFEPDHIPGLRFFELEDELSKLLGQKVDLNTPNFLSPHFRGQVLAEAQVQYVAP